MADRAFPRTAYHKGSEVGRVFVGGQEAEFVFGKGTQILPTLGAEIYGRTEARVVDDAGEKWFEMGFQMDHLLSGNPAAGWTDQGDYFRIDYEWSQDLTTWAAGKFVPAPTPIVDVGGGSYQYWARALNPVDAAIKSGEIRVSSGYGQGGINGDITAEARNSPFTALTVAGVSLPLGGFPYTMPDDAARMQTDLRAFYPDATIEASSSTVWRIIIPTVNFTSYSQTSKVWWPGYLIPDIFGDLTVLVDGAYFFGTLVDAAGTPIVTKAFGRLQITSGSRYNHLST